MKARCALNGHWDVCAFIFDVLHYWKLRTDGSYHARTFRSADLLDKPENVVRWRDSDIRPESGRIFTTYWAAVDSEIKQAKLTISTMYGSAKHIGRFHGLQQQRAQTMKIGRHFPPPMGPAMQWIERVKPFVIRVLNNVSSFSEHRSLDAFDAAAALGAAPSRAYVALAGNQPQGAVGSAMQCGHVHCRPFDRGHRFGHLQPVPNRCSWIKIRNIACTGRVCPLAMCSRGQAPQSVGSQDGAFCSYRV
jgi:hypothetical protein